MKKILTLLLFVLSMQMMKSEQIPIIDRQLFFGNPEISAGQLSPDGKWISFMKEYEGIVNVWVKKFDESFEKAKPLTDSKRPLYGYFWTNDGKYILYVKDKDGDENINIFAVNPSENPKKGKKIPESKNLSPLKDVQARIYMASRKNPDLIFIGLNDREKAWHDLYQLTISTGKLEELFENTERIVGYNFDWDENLRLLYRTDEKGNTTILRLDADKKSVPIYETTVSESASVLNWNEENSKFYMVTNKGELNLSTLFEMDPVSKKTNLIESDPEKRVDFGGLFLDRNTRKKIFTSYTDDKTRIYWQDKTWEDNYNFLKAKFPGREISFQSFTKDYKKLLIDVWGDKYVSDTYFFDMLSRELIHQYTPRPELKKYEEYLSPMQAIKYKSSDGLEIPAYLTTPVGKEPKNLPVVVVVHGGPKGPRDYWGYNSRAQFLANRGYAVLQANFRASGGYGKNFQNAGDLQWGLLMQDDITWGVKSLVEQGIADKDKIAIMGGSYGGYATLAGLAFTPTLYACGVDIVGPSNIFTLLESIPAYWEAFKASLYAMVGDPKTAEGEQRIREASPLFSADKIERPLLIFQGANDPRVKKAEADQIVIALRDKAKQVKYILADDEGHGYAKPVNRMAMYAEIEAFLAPILGGVYQKEKPDDVAKRLAEMTVDVSTVVYEPKKETEKIAVLPEINLSLKEEILEYDVKLEAQGKEIVMNVSRSIRKEGDKWIVKDISKAPMGESTDEIVYSATFAPEKRTIFQAGMSIPIEYSKDKMSLSVNGQQIDIPLASAYLSDAPGMDFIIAGMDIEKVLPLTLIIPDNMTAKVNEVEITNEGEEEFNGKKLQKIKLATQDNPEAYVFWINTEKQRAEKIVQTLAAMGNAKITITLK